MFRSQYQKSIYLLLLTCAAFVGMSCQKEFLDKKRTSNLVVPSTLNDLQELLDYSDVMRQTPFLGEISADNYFISDAAWPALDLIERNAYIWSTDLYDGTVDVADWNYPYQQVFYANIVLEGLEKLELSAAESRQFDQVRGSALFIRSHAFYSLSQIFCPAYDAQANSNPFGLPLRLNPGIDEVSQRSTLGATYERIILDLRSSIPLLTASVPSQEKNRPSKPAAYGLLARIFLSMGDYENAFNYADSSLKHYSTLIDYNDASLTANKPFEKDNVETMYYTGLFGGSDIIIGLYSKPTSYQVDTLLYDSYAADDLRKELFFKANRSFKFSYAGSSTRFTGIAVDEQYLIRAECYVRARKLDLALEDLNTLLRKRYRTGTYTDVVSGSKEEVLDLILRERRKELVFRGQRWSDLRRFNMEGRNDTLKRVLDGQVYQLSPGDNRWTFPIPEQVIQLSGIPQNPM